MSQGLGLSTALTLLLLSGAVVSIISVVPNASATSPFNFSTGSPDGKVGMASRPSSAGKIEIEAADDFIASFGTTINHATFIGLLPASTTPGDIVNVRIEIYRVFPLDSANPPSGNVPTRVNSPSDVAFAERDSTVVGDLTYVTTVLSSTFTVANTVVNGINKIPSQMTGGEGPATGQEVSFDVTLTNAINLPADHYFMIPQVQINGVGNFLWLSAPKPIVGGTGPFAPDLQAWIRNANLDPDWLRVGTDIIGAGAFNAAFSLSGTSFSGSTVPEFPIPAILAAALALVAVAGLRRLGRYYPTSRPKSAIMICYPR